MKVICEIDLEGKELVASYPSHSQVGFDKLVNKLLIDRYVLMRETGAPTTDMPNVLNVPGPVVRILREAAAAKIEVFITQQVLLGGNYLKNNVVGKYFSDMGLLDMRFDMNTFASQRPEDAPKSLIMLTNDKTGETLFKLRNFWVREAA